mgnify:CR=1 FL=1
MAQRLARNRRDAVCGGVAAGFADYFNVDPVLVRLGFVLLAFANGIGILFYLICWGIMPTLDDDERAEGAAGQTSPGERVTDEVRAAAGQVRAAAHRVASEVKEVRVSGRGHMMLGIALVGLGSILLFDRFAWMFRWPYWLRFGTLWPLILVAIGVALLVRSREERE